jgi:tyrosine-protein kinase
LKTSSGDIGRPVVDLREYLVMLWARKWLILLCTLLFGGLALAWTLTRTPVYVATSKVLVLPPQNAGLADALGASDPQAFINTEAQLVRSGPVVRSVANGLQPPVPISDLETKVRVAVVPTTNVLEIGYPASTPERAQAIAERFADSYLASRTATRAAMLRARGVSAKDDAGQVIQAATLPTSPASPQLVVNVALGLIVGFLIGLGVAFVLDARAGRVHGRSDLERRVGAPVLAVVPKDRALGKMQRPIVPTEQGKRTGASEAYATLATNVRYILSHEGLQTITITSSLAGEGKSMTCANLAVALAQAGQSVLVVSSDLRAPRIEGIFGLNGGRGLSDVVAGRAPLFEAIERSTLTSVSVLKSGHVSSSPVAVLSKLESAGVLPDLRSAFDVVLFDAPPILPVADAGVLASLTDGVLLVHNPRKANSRAVSESRDRLEVVGAHIVGVVFNAVEKEYEPYYGSHYGAVYDSRADNPASTTP